MSKLSILILMGLLSFSAELFGQIQEDISTPDTSTGFSAAKLVKDNVKFSLDMGSNGELYHVSGRQSQRPGSSGMMYLRPSINLFDRFSFSLDLFLSTEGNGAKQSMNTVAFKPEWSWGKLYYGDFNMEMSKFTLTDVKIKGYGVDLFPGIFKVQAFSGKSQKAISQDAISSMYERTIYGGKIGLGDLGGSHLHFSFLRVYDNKNSLSHDIFKQIDTTAVSGGSTRIDTNYVGVTPQENMIAGINWGLKLFNSVFQIKSEMAVSVFTADLYSNAINNKDIPQAFSKYYTPRFTSSADAALSSEMAINMRVVQLKGGYTYVGPGYTSLGMGTLINDKQIINGGLGVNLLSGNLILQTNFQTQSDNLAKQKLYTTQRNNIGVNLSVRPVQPLSISIISNINTMANNAKNDTQKVDIKSASYGVNTSLQFDLAKLKHVFNAGFNTQISEAKNILRGNTQVSAQGITFGLNTTYTEQINSTLSANINSYAVGNTKNSTSSLSAGFNYKMLQNKLNNALTYSMVTSESSLSNVFGYQVSYQLFEQSNISLQTRVTLFSGKGANPLKYSESSTTFNWSYRI